jgi:FkbM family methyltransferase
MFNGYELGPGTPQLIPGPGVSATNLVATYQGQRFVYPARSWIGAHIASGAEWTLALRDLAGLVEENACIIDVGSNVGASLLQMLAVRPAARAIAIEPSVRYLSCLRENLNSAGFSHAEIVPVALGRRTGEMWLHNNTTTASVVNMHYCGFEYLGRQLVKIRTLDDVLQHWGRASLIKVDTDGYDMEVLRGAEVVLRDDRPVVYFELEPRLLHRDPNADLAWLQSLGYRHLVCLDAAGRYIGTTDDPERAVLWARAPSSRGYCDVVCCMAGTELEERLLRLVQRWEAEKLSANLVLDVDLGVARNNT